MLKLSAVFLLLTPTSLATTLSYDWNIGFVTAAPDGVYRQVIGINGQWPLPTIEGTVGDIVTSKHPLLLYPSSLPITYATSGLPNKFYPPPEDSTPHF